ncbi:glycosyltransferase involved in cell wall biosynthesis [Methylobacterium brachiatum]|uniref:Glycosyltransferase involved in cell wall biosynthesis n=1 Tax=Methylobacterium brachiatum TaxID=269660 RepID=A0AAJ1TV43_9HYPH|nr:glycosyltransferase [Methylobacterium brachiatum]MCB4804286.1 glycosyltransferase [Methylobacterium brachiatum]MDQ0545301.1 glycosyltransferase involved in cell wall biosynthesis [Methylobacterium brachiatum]
MRRDRPVIHVYPDGGTQREYMDACAYLRMISPYSQSSLKEEFDISLVNEICLDEAVDVIVIQRQLRPGIDRAAAEKIIDGARKKNIKIVWDVDDNFLDTHPNPRIETYFESVRPAINTFLHECDHVVVSTTEMKDRLRFSNKPITVSPNAISMPLNAEARHEGHLTIGYFGTFTHLRDFLMVVEAIRGAVKKANVDARVSLCGISEDDRILHLFDGIAPVQKIGVVADYNQFFSYMASSRLWDIGLCPLRRGAFEDCKSDIKFLEYTAFGASCICSEHPAYKHISSGELALLCESNTEAWENAIVKLLLNKDLRHDFWVKAKDYVVEHRSPVCAAETVRSMLRSVLA